MAERIERLEKIGFVWEVRSNPDDAFDNHLQELIDFQATNGHLKNKRLRKWLQTASCNEEWETDQE